MGGFDNQGLALGDVYGFRWWNLQPDGLVTGMRGAWTPGVNRAVCQLAGYPCRHEEPAPYEECGCGMWAYWTREAAPIPNGRRLAGVVRGWGDTLIGDQGCRCQLAEIVALAFEAVTQDAIGTEEIVRAAGPPAGVHWRQPEGAMKTYLAFGGTPVDTPVRRTVIRHEENLVRQAADETALAARYRVPVYTTIEAMLALHPLTADYLPPPPTVEELTKLLDNMADFGRVFSAQVDKMLQHTISGADALARLAKRMEGS